MKKKKKYKASTQELKLQAAHERLRRKFVKRLNINFSQNDDQIEFAANILGWFIEQDIGMYFDVHRHSQDTRSPEIIEAVKMLFEKRQCQLQAVIDIVSKALNAEADLESYFTHSLGRVDPTK